MPAPADLQRPGWLVWFRKYLWVIAFLLGMVTLTALRCTNRLRHIPDPPEVMFELPQYSLVDHHERPFTPQTLQGRVWIAGFIFTSCPSSCPVVTKAMADLRDRYDRYGVDVDMVSFTVDPEHDTPAVLASYVEEAGADNEHWRFVTGEPQQVIELVTSGFKLGVGDREADEQGVAYDIAHSTKLALVDGNGAIRGFYGIDGEHGTDEIFERAQHVLAEQEMAQ